MEQYELSVMDANAQLAEELKRNLSTLFATRAGSQPVDREFGISWECLDEPPEVAESLFYLEASRKVERYEPRVLIENITFETREGILIPHLYLKRKEVT
nr:MAG TPA: lysozyme [Caudoviricetes sp.]